MHRRANHGEMQKKVRSQLVFFFGHFRSESDMTKDQRAELSLERKRFEKDLTDLLMDLDATKEAITSALTSAMTELAREPAEMTMPNPAGVCERVQRRLLPEQTEHSCAACTRGDHIHRGGRTFETLKGVILIRQTSEWLCHLHFEAFAFVANRSRCTGRGNVWPYPMPWTMLGDDNPLEAWAIRYVEEAYGKAPTVSSQPELGFKDL